MKSVFLIFTLCCATLFAEVRHEYPTQALLDSGTLIIDIRTPSEWEKTGLLKGAIPIMFYDERGRYDIDAFLKTLLVHVSKEKPFALICHTGSRTRTISAYLDKELGYKVINLQGGMIYAISKGLPTQAYKAP